MGANMTIWKSCIHANTTLYLSFGRRSSRLRVDTSTRLPETAGIEDGPGQLLRL